MATVDYSPADSGYNNAYLDCLIWGAKWSGTITYTFGDTAGQTWTYDEQQAFRNAFAQFEAVSNVSFQYVRSYDVNLAEYEVTSATFNDPPTSITLADHHLPTSNADPNGADTRGRYNVQHSSWSDLRVGGMGFSTIVHEIGHALGLEHPHDGDQLFPGVERGNAFGDLGDNNLNQAIWTVMSYNRGWSGQSGTTNAYGHAGGLMAFDIAAIQILYGTDWTTRSGADTYVLPTANASGTYWNCIWDGGGVDTISNAASFSAATIDLRQAPLTGANAGGYVSWIAGIAGGFTIANRAVIENAVGGGGNDTVTGNEVGNNLNGAGGDDSIVGWDGNDTINGGDGNDTLNGYGDNDLVNGDAGNDIVYGSAGNDTLFGGGHNGPENDQLYGETGDDLLVGSGGDDTLDGGDGIDRLHGGAGNDTYIVRAGDYLASNAESGQGQDAEINGTAGGVDRVISHLSSYTLGSSFENLDLDWNSGSGVTTGHGNADANSIGGNQYANTLDGRGGADFIIGWNGNDTINGGDGNDYVNGYGDNDSVNGDAGNDTVYGSDGNDTLYGGGFGIDENDRLYGENGADILVGSGGNDHLFGGFDGADDGGAADTLHGGAGDDVYVLHANDVIATGALPGHTGDAAEVGGGGVDTVRTYVSHVLNIEFEHLVMLGNAALVAYGNTVANNMTGNGSNNDLYGGEGADTLLGAGGDDYLVGGSNNDLLEGGFGSDTLTGDSGLDTLIGGGDNDTYYVNDRDENVVEDVNAGLDAVYSRTTFFELDANVEHLYLDGSLNLSSVELRGNGLANTIVSLGGNDTIRSGDGADSAVGGSGNDLLYGFLGNDTLVGGIGADKLFGESGLDSMVGGDGNDIYYVDRADEFTVEHAGQGTDRVYSGLSDYALAAEIEYLYLTGSGLNGTGNGSQNIVTGNGQNNRLSGMGEKDTLEGAAGSDTLDGGAGFDRLVGDADNDSLIGGDDNDYLIGGAGNDTLFGGAHKDFFVFDAALGATNLDTIQQFERLDDTIQLDRTVFTQLTGSGSNGLGSIGLGVFAYKAGSNVHADDVRIVYDRGTGQLWYDATGGAMADAVQIALMDSGLIFGRSDFHVVA